jgi:sec-independent protein translocase protein TatA
MAIGPWQILVVVVVLLLLFGASRLSEIGRGLGEGIRNFKKGLSEDADDKQVSGTDQKELPDKKEKESESTED